MKAATVWTAESGTWEVNNSFIPIGCLLYMRLFSGPRPLCMNRSLSWWAPQPVLLTPMEGLQTRAGGTHTHTHTDRPIDGRTQSRSASKQCPETIGKLQKSQCDMHEWAGEGGGVSVSESPVQFSWGGTLLYMSFHFLVIKEIQNANQMLAAWPRSLCDTICFWWTLPFFCGKSLIMVHSPSLSGIFRVNKRMETGPKQWGVLLKKGPQTRYRPPETLTGWHRGKKTWGPGLG